MPQLDKVTLFSQVFWLVLLYFLFFLYFLKYYLPNFSKLFTVRNHYILASSKNEAPTSSGMLRAPFLPMLDRFNVYVGNTWILVLETYAKTVSVYNKALLRGIHEVFKVVYIYSCLKFSLFKALGLFSNGIQAD